MTRPRGRVVVGVLAAVLAVSSAGAQALRFDVAAVRPNDSGLNTTDFSMQPGGRFGATNAPLRELIQIAYGVNSLRLIAPDWTTTARYDITARKEGDPTRNEILQMVRTLLEDRFRLTSHPETRQLPIYALVQARADGTLGPRLRRSTVDCAAITAAAQQGVPVPSGGGARILCGRRNSPGRIVAGGLPMNTIASGFASIVGRVVVDRTGLDGEYDFDLDFAVDPTTAAGPAAAAPSDAPSIFTAVQEQLGLRLQSTTGPVDVLVVDRVEPPIPD